MASKRHKVLVYDGSIKEKLCSPSIPPPTPTNNLPPRIASCDVNARESESTSRPEGLKSRSREGEGGRRGNMKGRESVSSACLVVRMCFGRGWAWMDDGSVLEAQRPGVPTF